MSARTPRPEILFNSLEDATREANRLDALCDHWFAHAEALTGALEEYLAPHESWSHPGSGGDPSAAGRLQRLRDALAAWRARDEA